MRDYFIRLLDYDCHTNRLLVKAIEKSGSPEKPVTLMAHVLGAQQVWLGRCQHLPGYAAPVWPDWKAGELLQVIEDNHRNWLTFLSGLEPGDFSQPVKYSNTKGEVFENLLCDVLGHLFNHGTHHRAQIGVYLKTAGTEPLPPTDYIFYLREKRA